MGTGYFSSGSSCPHFQFLVGLLWLTSVASAQPLRPDLELALTPFPAMERARLIAQVGSLEEMPFYLADLHVDVDTKTVTGELRIRYVARAQSMRALWLYVQANAADGTRVELSDAKRDGENAVIEQPAPTLFRVTLSPALAPTASTEISFTFKAQIPDALGEAFGRYENAISLAGLLPVVCADTEHDELADSSNGIGEGLPRRPGNWLVSVTAPGDWKVLSPQETMGELPAPNGLSRYTFVAAASRDFPLLLTRGYKMLSTVVGELTLESHFAADDARAASEVLKHAVAALNDYQRRLGSLPWKRLKLISLPLNNIHHGFGHSALVPIPQSLLHGPADPLLGLGVTDVATPTVLVDDWAPLAPAAMYTLPYTVAHQLAHQFFGAWVGSDLYETPVLSEALAQTMAARFIEGKYGRKIAELMKHAQWARVYQLYRYQGGQDDAAARSVADFESRLEYAALTLGKAPFLFDEVRKRVGDATWLRVLRRYVDDYAYLQASTDTLLKLLVAQAPAHQKALEQLHARYWLEAHGDEDLVGAKTTVERK